MNVRFDIVTSKRLIDCKNIDWSKIRGKLLNDMKNRFVMQIKMAKKLGTTFEVHSKTPISDIWKEWFGKKGIRFVED